MTAAFTDIDGIRHGDRALVLKPILKIERERRDAEAMLEETIGLARAIDLEVIEASVVRLPRPMPATLLGRGQVDHYREIIAAKKIVVAIVDHPLVPVQQRNLEKEWRCKVIDRTGLILEIFGERARTKEGMLQVELAALEYQKSRLVRSWTHLERQRGGFGFLGGPGESQLEVDRRLISKRILKLKDELKQVRRTRGLQREARQRAEHPTIALVGYTNAGKSSLFNRLTGADVLAKDMLFATLDPSMRGFKLPGGAEAILSDTVGFISDLPTHLVESFRATLEEVQLADLILHVRDVSHPETRAQKEAVLDVLADLGIGPDDERLIEVLNKIDKLPAEEREHLKIYAARTTEEIERLAEFKESSSSRRKPGSSGALDAAFRRHDDEGLEGIRPEAAGGIVAVSAVTGEGIDDLLKLLSSKLAASGQIYEIDLPLIEGAALAWLHAHGKVLKKRDTKTKTHVKVQLAAADYGRFKSRFEKSSV